MEKLSHVLSAFQTLSHRLKGTGGGAPPLHPQHAPAVLGIAGQPGLGDRAGSRDPGRWSLLLGLARFRRAPPEPAALPVLCGGSMAGESRNPQVSAHPPSECGREAWALCPQVPGSPLVSVPQDPQLIDKEGRMGLGFSAEAGVYPAHEPD